MLVANRVSFDPWRWQASYRSIPLNCDSAILIGLLNFNTAELAKPRFMPIVTRPLSFPGRVEAGGGRGILKDIAITFI